MKNKKLQLKKETVATLNDKSLHGIYGGSDVEEGDDGIELDTLKRTKCLSCESLVTCPSAFPICKKTIDPGPSCGDW